MRYKAVFISPHLDDAVFSCGGLIGRLATEGPVLVLNLFDRYAGGMKQGAIAVDDGRHEEERSAGENLGFASQGLGELDAVFRRPAYRSPANLFRPPQAADLADLPRFREAIEARLAGLDYDRLYIPLGIGWHVDHVLTHLALQRFGTETGAYFYEDAPYCLIPNATLYRLRELGHFVGAREDRAPFAEWRETAGHYLRMAPMQRLGGAPFRMLAGAVVSVYLWRLMRQHRRLQEPAGPPRALASHLVELDDEAFQRKLEAVWRYRSQAAEFFLDRQDCATQYLNHARRINTGTGAVERYWQFVD